MKITDIRNKLEELGTPVSTISLGDFDAIGELTAKRQRGRDNELYKSVGAFYRPNYERGMLIWSLIRKFNVKSYLEIGFGRGYSSMCAAYAMYGQGINGKIVSVDVNFDENQLNVIKQSFPQEMTSMIHLEKGNSATVLKDVVTDEFDFIYIDGDHTFEAVMNDWQNVKDRFKKIVLFDDYHLPTKKQKAIDVTAVVDKIDGYEKELIKMDRRIFLDDRGYTDDQIDYGQVLIVNPDIETDDYMSEW